MVSNDRLDFLVAHALATALLSAMNVVRELDPQAPNLLALDGQCSQPVVNFQV